MRATPASCSTSPDRMPSIVDLPQPDGPRMATNEPRSAVRLKSSSTSIDPPEPTLYDFDTCSRTAAASGMGDQRDVLGRRVRCGQLAGRLFAPSVDSALERANHQIFP